MKVRIHKADRDDMHKGWIRISEELDLRNGIRNMAYVKVSANNRKVYCQIRGTPEKAGLVEINEWYRNAFGWTDPPDEEVELTIEKACFLGKIIAFVHHPDDIVRIGIGLGIISVGLGLTGVILVISNIISIAGIVQDVFYSLAILVAIALVCVGFVILLGKSHKPID